MNVLDLDVVPDSLVYWHMTLTLLHVSWIGLVIGLIAATGNRVLRNRNANVRYWLNSVSLFVIAVSLPLTFAVVRSMSANDDSDVTRAIITSVPAPQHGALLPTATADATPFAPDQPADSFNSDRSVRSDSSVQSVGSDRSDPVPSAVWAKCQRITKSASPFVAALYFIGVALMLIKLAIGVRVSRSLRAASQPISDADLLGRMVTQAKKLSLRVVPVIAYCEHVAVPIVIGLLRPMILVPTAMVNGLTTEQLESVLTHELAHLRRHDHLLIVAQRVLEAVLFFHPVTWYLSRRIHDEREICCDDLVLAIGGNRLQYAQSLLRVAELRLAAASCNDKSFTALAADGQRPSKLRQRIARLLGEGEPTSIRVSTWMVAFTVGLCASGIWSVSALSTAAIAVAQEGAETDVQQVLRLINQNRQTANTIQTAHLRYRVARPGDGLKPDLTQKKVQQILETHDLTKSSDNFRIVMQELLDVELPAGATPWSTIGLYHDENRFRVTKSWADGGLDEHVHDGTLAFDWSAANHQMNIMTQAEDRLHEVTLYDLLPSRARWFTHLLQDQKILKDATISRTDGKLILFFNVENEHALVELNPASGQLLRFVATGKRNDDTTVTVDYRWFGWKQYGENLWFPSVVADLKYANDALTEVQLIVVESANLNKPLPDGIFQLSAPAGSVIVDKRPDGGRGGSINYDVYDVTSNEQLEAAFKPLSKELTDAEKAGVAEISRLYYLPDGVVMKHFGPPYSLARKHIGRLLGSRSLRFQRDIYANLLTWDGNKFEHAFMHDGGSFSAASLALRFTGIGDAELEGDADLLALKMPGDFVYQKGASADDLLPALQKIVSDAAGTAVKIEFRDVERTVYRATGKLKLNLPEGSHRIEISGGQPNDRSYKSVSTGDSMQFVQNISAYLKSTIVDEVAPSVDHLTWFTRESFTESTKPEDRFIIDPDVVLQHITEQTGIKFLKEKQQVRVLFIEREKGQRAAAGAAKAPVQVKSVAVDHAPAETTDVKPLIAPIDKDHTLPLPKQVATKLHGHVRDAEGKPIAEANVAVRTTSVGIPKTMQAKTNASGRFELELSGTSCRKAKPLLLWVWASGYAVNVETQLASMDDAAKPVNITLTTPEKERIRVTDPSGNGVANMDVFPSDIAIQIAAERGYAFITPLLDDLQKSNTRTTDAEGYVELDSVQGASLYFVAIHSDTDGTQKFEYGLRRFERDESSAVRLTLQPTSRVRGKLVGAPEEFLKGVRIDLKTKPASRVSRSLPDSRVNPVYESKPIQGSATAITDEQGHFEVNAILTGDLSVTQNNLPDARWRLLPNRHTLIAGTSPEIEFVLKETVEVPFKIIREDSGLPVAGVRVSITDESGTDKSRVQIISCTSDERGEFRARVFEDTSNVATVDFVPAQFTPPTDENDFAWLRNEPLKFQSPSAADKFAVPVVPITVPKGKMLRGQLVDLNNEPLAHWTVLTRGSGGETDADGKFRIMVRDNNQSPPNKRTQTSDPLPSDWATRSPYNFRGVPKVVSESPLVLEIMDYSKAVLPPGPEQTVPVYR